MQDMMGGFFELELPEYANFPYSEGPCCVYLNSGRSAFECLLRNRPRPERIWIPRFICDTVLQAPARLGIPVERYSCTDRLQPVLPATGQNDLVLLVNYFGLTGDSVAAAAGQLPGQCVIDATTALYNPPLPGVPVFYSPRKFCGMADGGVACASAPLPDQPTGQDTSNRQYLHLLQRLEGGACAALQASDSAEFALNNRYLRMSPLSRRILRSINFHTAATRRLENYAILHRALGGINRLQLPETPSCAPMCYPLVCGIPGLRDTLIDAGVALPLYWPEVIEQSDATEPENYLARTLLPLPLDQRYRKSDMERLVQLILG